MIRLLNELPMVEATLNGWFVRNDTSRGYNKRDIILPINGSELRLPIEDTEGLLNSDVILGSGPLPSIQHIAINVDAKVTYGTFKATIKATMRGKEFDFPVLRTKGVADVDNIDVYCLGINSLESNLIHTITMTPNVVILRDYVDSEGKCVGLVVAVVDKVADTTINSRGLINIYNKAIHGGKITNSQYELQPGAPIVNTIVELGELDEAPAYAEFLTDVINGNRLIPRRITRI